MKKLIAFLLVLTPSAHAATLVKRSAVPAANTARVSIGSYIKTKTAANTVKVNGKGGSGSSGNNNPSVVADLSAIENTLDDLNNRMTILEDADPANNEELTEVKANVEDLNTRMTVLEESTPAGSEDITRIDAELGTLSGRMTVLEAIGPVDAYTKTETDTRLDGKANAGDVYTKDAVNQLLGEKQGGIDAINTALTDKQDKLPTGAAAGQVLTAGEGGTLVWRAPTATGSGLPAGGDGEGFYMMNVDAAGEVTSLKRVNLTGSYGG